MNFCKTSISYGLLSLFCLVSVPPSRVNSQNPVALSHHEIIFELRAAHKYLQMANHDYKGHRVKASHEVHQAIHQLEKHHHAHHSTPLKGTVNHPHPKHHHRLKGIHEPQQLSDTQVKIAQDILIGLQGPIANLPKNKHTSAAMKHVTDAIVQAQSALTVSPLNTPRK